MVETEKYSAVEVKTKPRSSYFNRDRSGGENKIVFEIKTPFDFRNIFTISNLCFYNGTDWVCVLENFFQNCLTFMGNVYKFYLLPNVWNNFKY